MRIFTTQNRPAERAAEQLGKDLLELDEMVNRREEWMCAQVLFYGAG
ncbi:major capsid protein [Escherichia coli]|nr:major capsid protein [Escherichia coli]